MAASQQCERLKMAELRGGTANSMLSLITFEKLHTLDTDGSPS